MTLIVGISGSSRKGGNTSTLIEIALKSAQEVGAETELIELSGMDLRPCKHQGKCYELGECEQDDDLNIIVKRMMHADGIIFGSPVHFGSVTAAMKNFMDRAGRFAHLEGKVGCSIVVANRSGADITESQMIFFMLVKEMIIPGGSYWPTGTALNVGDIRSDLDAIDMAKQMGRRVAQLADILHKVPVSWHYEPLPEELVRFGERWREDDRSR